MVLLLVKIFENYDKTIKMLFNDFNKIVLNLEYPK